MTAVEGAATNAAAAADLSSAVLRRCSTERQRPVRHRFRRRAREARRGARYALSCRRVDDGVNVGVGRLPAVASTPAPARGSYLMLRKSARARLLDGICTDAADSARVYITSTYPLDICCHPPSKSGVSPPSSRRRGARVRKGSSCIEQNERVQR